MVQFSSCGLSRFSGVSAALLTDIGLSSGHYDQAHFGREFRRLASMPPGPYAACPTAFPAPPRKRQPLSTTGKSTGTGKATAELFGRERGVRLALTYHSGKDRAQEAVQLIEKSGAPAMAVHMNLGDQDRIGHASGEAKVRFGGVDVLVCNAVQWPNRCFSFEEGPISEWESFLSVNLSGTMKTCPGGCPFHEVSRLGPHRASFQRPRH